MRSTTDLQADPNLPFRIGRLVSAAELLCHYNMTHGDENAQTMARHVHQSIDYFLDETEKHSTDHREADTLILPPAPKGELT